MTINRFFSIPYVEGGRSPAGLDCWGLVRVVLADEFGIYDLPEFGGITRTDQTGMNAGFKSAAINFVKGLPVSGAVACCFDAHGNMLHVGVVIETERGLCVLHTGRKHGVLLQPLRIFIRANRRVEFFKYVS